MVSVGGESLRFILRGSLVDVGVVVLYSTDG